jgi:hypothetical protein
MATEIPADLIVFGLTVVGFFAIGLPRIVRRVSLPVRVEFEKVGDSER